MKKVITAIGNEYLNEKLKQEEIKVIGKDIQYIEGVLEQLEIQNDINIIIISTKLINENKYKDIIKKINLINEKIKIIFIIENKNKELINYLKNKKIKYYFNLNNNISNLIKYLKLENIILNKIIKNKKYIKLNKKTCKIVTITGSSGCGKTIFTGIISKLKKEKILLIDLDNINKSLHILFNVNNKIKNINKNKIIKINNNIDFLININLEKNEIKKIINKYQSKYNYILIDASIYYKNYNVKQILKNSDNILFITEGNILQINKSNKILNYYLKKWNIKKEKINIILNKSNRNTVQKDIMKNIFLEYKFLGEIKFNTCYDSLINNNLNTLIMYPKIINEYKKIINKL